MRRSRVALSLGLQSFSSPTTTSGDDGAGPPARLDEPGALQLPVGPGNRVDGEAQVLGQSPDRGQSRAGHEFAGRYLGGDL